MMAAHIGHDTSECPDCRVFDASELPRMDYIYGLDFGLTGCCSTEIVDLDLDRDTVAAEVRGVSYYQNVFIAPELQKNFWIKADIKRALRERLRRQVLAKLAVEVGRR